MHRLRRHSNRKIGKDCEHVNSKRKSFCWKRLALFDVGIGPQLNLKKPRKHSIKTPCFTMLLVSCKQSSTSFSIIENQKTWVNMIIRFCSFVQ